MYVNGMGPNGPPGPEGASGPRPIDGLEVGSGAAQESLPREREDRVEISDQGRAMAEAERAGLAPEQIARLRGRVDAGFYNRSDVMAETAVRIARSGDL